MQITRNNIDELNAILKVQIVSEDYQEQVTKILKDYRKKADIPGFRKGFVPMGLIKKQYGEAIEMDEVNKLLQKSLNDYLVDEKLDIMASPIPVDGDIKKTDGVFEFKYDIAFKPKFSIELEKMKGITKHEILLDDELVDKQVKNYATRYGKITSQEEVGENSNVVVEVEGLKVEGDSPSKTITISPSDIKGKRNLGKIISKKVGDVIEYKTKNLFLDNDKLAQFLGVTVEELDTLEVKFIIKEISISEGHEINKDLFDKVYGEGKIETEKDFRNKIKEDASKAYSRHVEEYFVNKVSEELVNKSKIELPKEFLKKWIKINAENPMTEEEINEEFEKSTEGLKYQLIEQKIFEDYKIQIELDDVKEEAKEMIKEQMAQFGQNNMSDEELDNIINSVISNQDEVNRISNIVKVKKLTKLYIEKIPFKIKKLSLEAFMKEVEKK